MGLNEIAGKLGIIESGKGNPPARTNGLSDKSDQAARAFADASLTSDDKGLILRYLEGRSLKPTTEQANILWAAGIRVWRWKDHTEIIYPVRAPGADKVSRIGRIEIDPVVGTKLDKKTMGKVAGDSAFLLDPHPGVEASQKKGIVIEGLEDALSVWFAKPDAHSVYIVTSGASGLPKVADFLKGCAQAVVMVDPDPPEPVNGSPLPSLKGALKLKKLFPKTEIYIPRLGNGIDANQAQQGGRIAEWITSLSSPTEQEIELAQGLSKNDKNALILDPKDPFATAEQFIELCHSHKGAQAIYNHRGAIYAWIGTHYQERDEGAIRADLYRWLKGAFHTIKTEDGPKLVPFKPNRSKVADVMEALKAAAYLDTEIDAPALLDPGVDLPADKLVSCRNGLLELPTGKLYNHTPAYFSTFSLPFDFTPDGPKPVGWLTFLRSQWPQKEVDDILHDGQEIQTLKQIFGLMLTPNTAHQKIFMFQGPKRSGKGTIARVLTALLGKGNTAGPSLHSLSQPFGRQGLIGKQCAIISDARLSTKTDGTALAEHLLSISGEDLQDIPRKYKEVWVGTLPVRFLLLTNEIPKIADASGALPGRFIILKMTESFYGREDLELGQRLAKELPLILNWAVDGWAELEEKGHFIQPDSSQAAIQQMEDMASPVSAFIRDSCSMDAHSNPDIKLRVERPRLFLEWKKWCVEQNMHPATAEVFGRDLNAAHSHIGTIQVTDPMLPGVRQRYYTGVRLMEMEERIVRQ